MSKLNKVLILDYSPTLPRTTRGFGLSDMAILVKELNPRYVVLPCVDYSCDRTLKFSKESANYLSNCIPEIEYLALPQGSTKKEIEQCAVSLLTIPGVRLLGLSASLEPVSSRSILKLKFPCVIYMDTYNSFEDEVAPENTKGVISSLPIRLGIEGKRLLDKCSTVGLDFSYKGDSQLIEENVDTFCDYVGDLD